MKKILACLLCALLLLPLFTQAEEPETFASGDYKFILLEDGTAEITEYSGNAESLIFPAELDGHSVTSIGNGALALHSSLTSVTFPDGVTSIGNWVFYDCFSLTDITIPDSVTSIGDWAFSGCDSLTLTVARDSYAEQYCKENGLAYTYTDGLD